VAGDVEGLKWVANPRANRYDVQTMYRSRECVSNTR
jgi:hypothetical protein